MRYWKIYTLLVGAYLPALGAEPYGDSEHKPFVLSDLPKGAQVTLPHPAITQVQSGMEVMLSSTDLPQMVKFTSLSQVQGVELLIYDDKAEKVQKVKLRPKDSTVYSFKSLNSIRIVAKMGVKRGVAASDIRIESNKPLGIGR